MDPKSYIISSYIYRSSKAFGITFVKSFKKYFIFVFNICWNKDLEPLLSCTWNVWTLQWHHNDHDGVSNHQPHGCLLNGLFRRRSKKTSKLRTTGLCVGNSPGPVNSPHKGPVTRKMFPFDDVIMNSIQKGEFLLKRILLYFYDKLRTCVLLISGSYKRNKQTKPSKTSLTRCALNCLQNSKQYSPIF